ncbi:MULTISPECIES: hypothetical protein [Streptomyces]|uniref:Uncharacterized protein n=1 Tax=Streptomyces mirabilis TaxID=68239 RepID=A0A1I2QJK2_9ACTN|nr:hypothetical protein [Streptomyces mirabilis]SFG27803.1 hypothetical protein SAMN02787118_11847 [Streptomyces mirabilis]
MIEKVLCMVAVRKPYLLGHAEIAALYGVERQTSQKWRAEGTLAEPDLVISGNPYWLLSTVLQLSDGGARDVTEQRLAEYEASIPGGNRAYLVEQLPVIVGIMEVAKILGQEKQAIARWRHRKQIAASDYELSGSPLWLIDTILADATARGRAVVQVEVERLSAGARGLQRPRGRRSTPPAAHAHQPPLPAARTFTSDQGDEAASFLAAALAQGHSVVIRPKRQKS